LQEEYAKIYAVSEEEKESQILFWETHLVLEATGDGDHPMNRKVNF
jgi:hypothetical protein